VQLVSNRVSITTHTSAPAEEDSASEQPVEAKCW